MSVDPQEFAKYYQEYVEKLNSASEALATHGMASQQFAQADARAGEAFAKLKAVQKNGHWSR
ncbi:MAG TPA: hypothetical protein VMU31_09815 [Rhizomicrobium sp.]|nr:hypothetical protein [Rhizomicrobium sp.]